MVPNESTDPGRRNDLDAQASPRVPPSERLRHQRRVQEGEREETRLFEHALTRFVGSEDPASRERVRDAMRSRRAEIVDAVEADRVTFREAFIEHASAGERYSRARRALFTLLLQAGLGGTLLATAISSEQDYLNSHAAFTIVSLGVLVAGMLVTVGSTAVGRTRSFLEARHARRTLTVDLDAAQTLFMDALVDVGFPEAARRSRNRARHGPIDAVPPAEPETNTQPSEAATPGQLLPIAVENLVEAYRGGGDVETGARTRLRLRIRDLVGASIGVAGPRGVGKSTLIRSVFAAQRAESGHFAVEVSAPVKYDPREFVLTLFAQVCEQVVGADDETAETIRGPRTSRQLWRIAGGAIIAAGVMTYTGAIHLSATRTSIGLDLILLGALITGASARLGREASALPSPSPTTLAIRSSEPEAVAERVLRDIRYQLTYSAGFGGKLTAPIGEISGTASYSLAARQESYPEIVARFRAFVEALARRFGRVLIAIDELDKLPVEDTVRFLDDIKGLFGVEGCFFVLAVSEDALAQFERRGVPARDSFDSAFDEVVRVAPFSLAQSVDLLEGRTENLPRGLSALCHTLAGGLPREVIRFARQIGDASQRRPTASDALVDVVAADLSEKVRGTRVTLRARVLEPEVEAVDRWLEGLRAARRDAGMLIDACADAPWEAAFGAGLGAPTSTVDRTIHGHVLRIATFAYIVATILALAAKDDYRLDLLQRCAPELARARLALSVTPAEAWEICDRVRAMRGLETASRPGGFLTQLVAETGEPGAEAG